MTPVRNNKAPITNTSILKSPYFQTNRGEYILNKYSKKIGKPTSVNLKIAEKKHSIGLI